MVKRRSSGLLPPAFRPLDWASFRALLRPPLEGFRSACHPTSNCSLRPSHLPPGTETAVEEVLAVLVQVEEGLGEEPTRSVLPGRPNTQEESTSLPDLRPPGLPLPDPRRRPEVRTPRRSLRRLQSCTANHPSSPPRRRLALVALRRGRTIPSLASPPRRPFIKRKTPRERGVRSQGRLCTAPIKREGEEREGKTKRNQKREEFLPRYRFTFCFSITRSPFCLAQAFSSRCKRARRCLSFVE